MNLTSHDLKILEIKTEPILKSAGEYILEKWNRLLQHIKKLLG